MQAIARSSDIFSFVMENFIDNMEDLHHFYNSQLLQLRYITDKFLSPHFFKSVAFRIIILWPKTSESADYFVTPVPTSFSPLPCSNQNACLVMVNSIESSSCLWSAYTDLYCELDTSDHFTSWFKEIFFLVLKWLTKCFLNNETAKLSWTRSLFAITAVSLVKFPEAFK